MSSLNISINLNLYVLVLPPAILLYSLSTFHGRSVNLITSPLFISLKEVIQPHLLILLPCYDFSPVTSFTLGSCLPFGLAHQLRVPPAPMPWRAVCTRPGNAFTPTCWFGITSNSIFMWAGCSPQSELRWLFWGLLNITISLLFVVTIVARLLPKA